MHDTNPVETGRSNKKKRLIYGSVQFANDVRRPNEFLNRPKDETGKCAISANVGNGLHYIGRIRNDAPLPARSGLLTYSKSGRTLGGARLVHVFRF